ncbi:MAG: hypothetical protein AB1757_30180 [Acidobacteriota bacterium]
MHKFISKTSLFALFVAALLAVNTATLMAQGQSGQHGKSQKQEKQKNKLNKDANKLAKTAEQTEKMLGRNAVFCILAAHTTDVGTAQELKTKYDSLDNFPFGQFVAAVLLADRIDKPLDEILLKLQAGKSLGEITQEYGVDISEVRQHFGEFRSELAHSQTNPPTRDCFATSGS